MALLILIPAPVAFTSALQEPSAALPETREAPGGASALNEFSAALSRALAEEEGNYFFSPYSIRTALAMAYAGAEGETARQMEEVLGFASKEQLADSALTKLIGESSGEFLFRTVNAVWAQRGSRYRPAYEQVLTETFSSSLNRADFKDSPESARAQINQWAYEATESRISDLLPPGSVTRDTSLVLADAVFFRAAWEVPFLEERTRPDHFHLQDGTAVSVPMMRGSLSAGYLLSADMTAVELPYTGGEFSLLLLMPADLPEYERTLSGKLIGEVTERLDFGSVELTLPRFTFTSEYALKPLLSRMGLWIPFSGQADFSGMSAEEKLFISDVHHKAFIAVDEAGTEAAAATAVVMAKTSLPVQPAIVVFDRPFLLFIRERETGAVLFSGRILDPR
jgi:serpin B